VLHLEKLRADEIRTMPKEKTVVLIPVGPLEDHGDALPIGLDVLEAQAVSLSVATLLKKEGWTVVLAPAAHLGVDSNTSKIAIRVRPHVLRDYLVDFADSLSKAGFKYFIALSGHPGTRQLTVIEEAGQFLKKRHSRLGIFKNKNAPMLVSGSSIAIDTAEKSLSALFMTPPEHGGGRDTSIALEVASNEVDPALIATLQPIDQTGGTFEKWRKWRRGEIQSYWGNPMGASRAAGRSSIDEKAKTIAIKFRAGVESGKAPQLFKSWYSVFPTNQSLFKIWILVVCLTLLLGAWTFYSLQGLLAGADFN
jgi:creatinine amidohydrolase/Fe(II)-dependent formamide hydrolase-like protein